MCDPIALIGLAVSAASSVMGYQQQEAAYEQQQAIYQQNRLNAIAAFKNTNDQLNLRESQEQTAAAAERFDMGQKAQAAEATAMVAGGEAGVTGLSVDALVGDIEGRAGRYNDRVSQNLDWTTQQLQTEKQGAGYQAVDRINSVSPGTPPSFADAAIRIASGGLNSLTDYTKRTGNNPLNFMKS